MDPTNSNPFNTPSNSQEVNEKGQGSPAQQPSDTGSFLGRKLRDAVSFFFGKEQKATDYSSANDSDLNTEMKDVGNRKRKAESLENTEKTGHITSKILEHDRSSKKPRLEIEEEGESEFGLDTAEYVDEEKDALIDYPRWRQNVLRAVEAQDDMRVQTLLEGHYVSYDLLSTICRANLVKSAHTALASFSSPIEGAFAELLLEMCQIGNAEIAKMLVESGALPLEKTNEQETALHVACRKGYFDLVELFIQIPDVNMNEPTSQGMAPLQIAYDCGHEQIVRLLMESGKVDINFRRGVGLSLLEIALQKGDKEFLRFLLNDARIDPNIRDEVGNTPLHKSLLSDHVNEDIVYILLKCPNLDVNAVNTNGDTPLHLAVRLAEVSRIFEDLVQDDKVDVNIRNTTRGITPLYKACEDRNKGAVDILLKRPGIDLNLADNRDKAPFHVVCQNGDYRLIELLLAHPLLKPNIRDDQGSGPLLYALSTSNYGVIKRLIDNERVDVDLLDNYGQTLLHYVCDRGEWDIVQAIIDSKKANLSAISLQGVTPLIYASRKGFIKIVTILLEAGASPQIRGKHSASPLAEALVNGHGKCAKELIKFGACNDLVEQWDFAKRTDHITADMVCDLLEDFRGITQLIKESNLGSFKDIQLFLAQRAQDILVEAKILDRSPFEIAFFLQSYGLIEALRDSIGKSRTYHELETMLKAHPHVFDNIVNLFYTTRPAHYSLSNVHYSKLLPPPEGIRLEGYKEILDSLNFTEPEQPNYIDPSRIIIFGRQVGASDFIEQVNTYFMNVLNKQVSTMPESNSTASIYYNRLEMALKHIIAKLATEKPEIRFSALLELAAASGYCAAPYQQVALGLYQKLCLRILSKESFEEEIYDILRQQREMVLEFMCSEPYVNQHQSVHALNFFRKCIGGFLGISTDSYDDIAARSGFIDGQFPSIPMMLESFNKYYTPSSIYRNILESLESPELKSKFLVWAEKNCKDLLQDDNTALEIAQLRKEIKVLQDEYINIKFQISDIPEEQAEIRQKLKEKKNRLWDKITKKKDELEQKDVSVLRGMSGLSGASKDELIDRLRNRILSPIDGKPIPITLIQALEKLNVLSPANAN